MTDILSIVQIVAYGKTMELMHLTFPLSGSWITVKTNSAEVYKRISKFIPYFPEKINAKNLLILEENKTLYIYLENNHKNQIVVYLKHIHTDEDLFFLLKYSIQRFLPQFGIFIHSSCIIMNNKAHIFLGVSGAGKTTIAKNSNLPVLSDDLTILKVENNHVMASSSVLDIGLRQKKYRKFAEKTYKLEGIFFLKQSSNNELKKIEIPEALELLLRSTIISEWDKRQRELIDSNTKITKKQKLLIENIFLLLTQVRSYRLFFKKDFTFNSDFIQLRKSD